MTSKDKKILALIKKQDSGARLTTTECNTLLDFYRNLDVNIAKKLNGSPKEKYKKIADMTHKQRVEAYFGK